MKKIEHEENISPKLKDHPLTGNWKTHRELHVEPDWLLIYKLILEEKVVVLSEQELIQICLNEGSTHTFVG